MRYAIIGGGVAGFTAAQALRNAAPKAEVRIFTEERYPYYRRPMLWQFIAGEVEEDTLFHRPLSWYDEQDIELHLDTVVTGLDPKNKAPRVASFVDKMRKDVAMIAHSCGAAHARDLKRFHVRIQQEDGTSIPLDELLERRRPMAP